MLAEALPRNDSAPTKTDTLFDQWISNMVDTYNESMTRIENELTSLHARLVAGGL